MSNYFLKLELYWTLSFNYERFLLNLLDSDREIESTPSKWSISKTHKNNKLFVYSNMTFEDFHKNFTTTTPDLNCSACCRNETVDHDDPTIVEIDLLWYAVLALASFGGLLVSLISNIMIISIFSRWVSDAFNSSMYQSNDPRKTS